MMKRSEHSGMIKTCGLKQPKSNFQVFALNHVKIMAFLIQLKATVFYQSIQRSKNTEKLAIKWFY
jgi:hypothetical protein